MDGQTTSDGDALKVALAEYELLERLRAHSQTGSAQRHDAHLVALGFIGAGLALFVRADQTPTARIMAVSVAGVVAVILGEVTFRRLVQHTITSVNFTRGLNALRGFLLDACPELRPHFVLSTDETQPSIFGFEGEPPVTVLFATRAGAVAAVNALVVALVAGVWVAYAAGTSTGGLALAALVAAIVLAAGAGGYLFRQRRTLLQADAALEASRQKRLAGNEG